MENSKLKDLLKALGQRHTAHPWHGIPAGDNVPESINAFIEIIPSDTVKYEVDKDSGFLMIDRPQKFSNIIPALYGFVPQTYCDEEVAEFCREKTGRDGIHGDDDPLDICVLTEREVTHGNIIVKAKPIGGFRMIDGGEADDKIVAVLEGDSVYGHYNDISECPEPVINRLMHYFLTYKEIPGPNAKKKVEITDTYGREDALEVVRRSCNDYQKKYGKVDEKTIEALKEALNG